MDSEDSPTGTPGDPTVTAAQTEPQREPAGRGILSTRLRLPGDLEITFPQMLIVSGIVFYTLAMPGDLKFKLDAAGFGICHQIHTHSFYIGGHQLPLCARCTGIYLGAIVGLALLARLRSRSARLPSGAMIPVLGLFFISMVVDGLNSTAQAIGPSGLWDTNNITRIVTGALSGLSVAFFFFPVFNLSLWQRERRSRESVLDHPFQLLGYLLVAGLLVALVIDGGAWLYWPMALLSTAGALALLTMANTMLVLMAARREGKARTASELITPVLLGFAITLVMLTLLALLRTSLGPSITAAGNPFGLPLVPGLP
jgi:uncharacterized membrane protein